MLELLVGGGALWFTIPAIAGSVFFVLRSALALFGGDADVHHDLGDGGGPDLDADHPDSVEGFQILSVQAVSAFLLGFGTGGLAAMRGLGLPVWLSVVPAVATGSAMVWVVARTLRLIARFQSSGTMGAASALTEEGTVYLTVPAQRHGKGSVRIVVGDRQQYYQAVTDGAAIQTGARIRVLDVNDDNTLTVERIPDALPAGE